MQEIAALLLLAALCGAITIWLRQPLIVGYIVVGILVGPSLLGWVTAKDQIDLFAKMGIARHLQQRGMNILGVDFDSKAVTAWHQQGFQARYGDTEDPEFPGTLPLIDAEWVVSTITQLDINLALLDALRHHGYLGKKAMTALTEREAEILKESGTDLIFSPFVDAAKEATELLAAATVSKVPL